MEKKRVHQVAKEHHVSSEALITMLKSMGSDVKSHMSIVNDDLLEQINRKFEEEKELFRREIRRKKLRSEKHKEGEIESEERGFREDIRKKKRRRRKRKRIETLATEEVEAEIGLHLEVERELSKKKKVRFRKLDEQKTIEDNVRKTLARIESGVGIRHKKRRPGRFQYDTELLEEEKNILRVSEFVSASELAELIDVKPAEVIAKCLQMGLTVTINQRLDMDTIIMVADEFGFAVEPLAEYGEDIFKEDSEEDEDFLQHRPPVVTIMGHVDHGKTSLLDYIRRSNIIAGEVGGITQHIGAYEVYLDKGSITFLDTPGHEAFTAMRARGAQVTDIVILVIAANEDVMPQTIEAIDHARAAGVPIIVAINKTDLPDANPDKIKQQLAGRGVLVEGWGGNTPVIEISAKTGQNIEDLLDLLLIQAELLELKANPTRLAKGVIIESQLDKGRGPMATVLIQQGTLRVNDPFVTGLYSGRVRACFDERGKLVREAGPSNPVQVVGLEGVPQAGDSFVVMSSEGEARRISQKRQQLRREQEHKRIKRITLADIHKQIEEGIAKELRLIVKGDVDGSVEALSDSLMQISNDQVRVNVIHKGVGAISESDVLLAAASGAVVIGFQVRPDLRVRELAAQEQVDIKLYRIIYEAIDDVKAALEGLLPPEISELITGTVSVRNVFKIPQIGTIAGCFVQSGKIRRNSLVRVLRDNVVAYEGVISSLKRFKEDVREVSAGYECGIGIQGFNDIQMNDVFETYERVETARKLE